MKSAITPLRLRVMEAVMNMKAHNEHITIRSIYKRMKGHKKRTKIGHGTVHNAVVFLRNAGLISFNEHQAGTIQPRVRFIPASEL